MSREVEKQETYREQLTRLARSLAQARNEDVLDDLAAGMALSRVKMFTDGNLDKRFEKIQKQAEFVAGAFDDLDELIETFISSTAPAAYDTGVSDGEAFLQWVEQSCHPTAEQRDYIACQRARHAVEDVGRRNRLAHVRFQELLSMAEELAAELHSNRSLRIHLNPIRVWSQFETNALLDESADVPAAVLFYAVQKDIRTALLESVGIRRVDELCSRGTCTLDEWVSVQQESGEHATSARDELADFCRELAEIGLVAFS